MLRDEAYVPFDIDFSAKDGEAKVITGPNMAGKSSCVRATVSQARVHDKVALLIVGIDCLYGTNRIFCSGRIGHSGNTRCCTDVRDVFGKADDRRMGASDEIGRGKSTFMVELSETSDILRTLTPRTLVILDE
jgi:DNA mismatch repair protein MSH3